MKRYHRFLLVLLILPVFILAGDKGLHKKSAVLRAERHPLMIDHIFNSERGTRTESVLSENSMNPDKTLSPLAGIIRVPEDHSSIQAAIDAAVNGDTVLVADSTYYENINFKGKVITVASYFLVDGDTNHINNTIINGSQPADPNKGSVVSFVSGEDTSSAICGFTITDGTGTVAEASQRVGGGIYCKNSGARIIHNKIVSNTVNHTENCAGGGIGYYRQTNLSARYVIVENNIIESNSLTSANTAAGYLDGGGIHITKGRVTGNTIRYNSVGGQPRFAGGGGISATCEDDANRTLVVITGNTITHNTIYAPGYGNYGGGWGGGVDVVFANIQIIDNTICYNEAGGNNGVGAGIRLWKSKEISLIKDNFISYNSITAQTEYGWAGGIELWQTEGVQVIGNTIEGNNAGSAAGGIDESDCSGNLIKENLIKGNIGGYGGGIWATNSILINNIIVENEARRGGGIFCYHPPAQTANLTQIINNTLTKNVADTAGGIAIYEANTVVMNTICWDNTAPHGPEIEMWGGTLNAAYSDIRYGAAGIVIDFPATINWLTGNIVPDPGFLNSKCHLCDTSQCIDMGNPDTVYNDPEDPNNPGYALYPARGTLRNDMGAYGGPGAGKIVTAIKQDRFKDEAQTNTFALFQNYPNPFNPKTLISYQLPVSSQVDLSVYNILGQKVATLVSARQTAGYYTVPWEATGMASGLYLYRLQTDHGFIQTRKLILLK